MCSSAKPTNKNLKNRSPIIFSKENNFCILHFYCKNENQVETQKAENKTSLKNNQNLFILNYLVEILC